MLPPGVMTIWNARDAIRVSRFTFAETILSFSFNPFQPESLVCTLSCEAFVCVMVCVGVCVMVYV